MEFVTLDMEIADRMFPCVCSISIIKWNNNNIISSFSTLIDPETEIEPFMNSRHHISESDIAAAPTLRKIWRQIYSTLDKTVVFTFNGNKSIKYLMKCAEMDRLYLPDFQFASVQSICRRVWPDINTKTLPAINEHFDLNYKPYNSLADASSLGKIVIKAMEETKTADINKLFDRIGYSGGFIIDNNEYLYRSFKINKKYRTEDYIYDMRIRFSLPDLDNLNNSSTINE